MVKAKMVEQFSQFISWPRGALDDIFVVGIFGDDEAFQRLIQTFYEDQADVNGLPVEIRRVTTLEAIRQCDILVFLRPTSIDEISTIRDQISDDPILTVCDQAGAAKNGFHISFYSESETVGIEVNRSALRNAGLQMHPRLLRMATLVHTRR